MTNEIYILVARNRQKRATEILRHGKERKGVARPKASGMVRKGQLRHEFQEKEETQARTHGRQRIVRSVELLSLGRWRFSFSGFECFQVLNHRG